MNRPAAISSRLSAIFANSAGFRKLVQATSGPSVRRVVTAARALRKVKPSQVPAYVPSRLRKMT